MNSSNQKTVNKLEALLHAKANQSAISFLRHFACECGKRVSYLCTSPLLSRLLEFAGKRVFESSDNIELVVLRTELTRLYELLYPGYDSPSPAALALAAVGEAAFTESAIAAAIGAASFATDAKASSDAISANDDTQYDQIYDVAYLRERQAQLELFKRLESTNIEPMDRKGN